MNMFYIYLMMQADVIQDSFSSVFGFLMFVWVVGSIIMFFGYGITDPGRDENKTHWDNFNKVFKLFQKIIIPLIIIVFLIKTFMPSTKTVAVVVGTSVVYSAVTSETGQRLGNKAVEYLEFKINEAMSTIEPKEEEKK